MSKIKHALRAAAARTWQALLQAVGYAMRTVTPDDCHGWFRHCGYCPIENCSNTGRAAAAT